MELNGIREGEGKRVQYETVRKVQRGRNDGRKEASYRDSGVTVVVRRCPVVEQTRGLVSEPKRLSQPASQSASQPASERTSERASGRVSEPASSCFIQSGS